MVKDQEDSCLSHSEDPEGGWDSMGKGESFKFWFFLRVGNKVRAGEGCVVCVFV
jgi:hypothetical protein